MKTRLYRTYNSGVFSLILMLVMLFSLGGCSEKAQPPPPAHTAAEPAPVMLAGDDEILARVNGTPITRYELEQTISATLARPDAEQLDDAGRRKVLESLVAGRAIAQAQEANISAEDLAVIEKKTAAYREQLMVKQYLAGHVSQEPVSAEMVREYYEKHPERFGAKTIRAFEMIRTTRELKTQEQDALIEALKEPGRQNDWNQWAARLQKKNHPVAYQRGVVDEAILQPRLAALMRSLNVGETAQLNFIKGTAYLVRITEEKQVPPRPLAEVGARIRKALVPVQLKKAVKQASDEVMKTAEVVYHE